MDRFVVLAFLLFAVGCNRQACPQADAVNKGVKGVIVGSVREWPGPQYFLFVKSPAGEQLEVLVSQDVWIRSAIGDRFNLDP